jgi:hypothetical protein
MKQLGIALALAALGCWAPVATPELGSHFEPKNRHELTLIASAQMSPAETTRVGGITFTVAVNDQNRVIYVQSQDSAFRTPEGLSIDSTLAQVLSAGGKAVVYETGWAHYSQLPSGWCAVFYGPQSDLFKAPTSNSMVSGFFKRR